jgi:peptidoglycan/LPS O-acetylase OafA/YrhL
MRNTDAQLPSSLVGGVNSLSHPLAGKVRRYYRPELDVLRFVAFALVFFHHVFRDPTAGHRLETIAAAIGSSAANACGFGLCIFFFLSSYLITTLLMIELSERSVINVAEFYVRRILRIWPLYAFGLTLGIIFAFTNGEPADTEMFRYYAVFLGNWFFQNHGWGANPMTPLWSISVEEQFYLILPFFVLALGVKRIIWGGIGLIMLSAAALFYQGERHLLVDTAIWTNTLSHAIFFGAGMVAATMTYKQAPALNGRTRLIAAAGAFILMFLAAFVFKAKAIESASSGWSMVLGYVSVAVACTLLLVSLLNIGITLPAPMIYLGKISFGLYVYHGLAMRIMEHTFALGPFGYVPRTIADLSSLPLLVCYAAFSYRYLERPFLNLKAKFGYVASRSD